MSLHFKYIPPLKRVHCVLYHHRTYSRFVSRTAKAPSTALATPLQQNSTVQGCTFCSLQSPTTIKMHHPGSICPPPTPPTVNEATNILNDINDQASRYSTLMRHWNRSVPAVAAVFAPFPYLTRAEIQKLVERARVLVQRVGGSYQLNARDRSTREEYDMLVRLCTTTSENLDQVEEGLDDLQGPPQPQPRYHPRPSRPNTRPNNAFHPTSEVLQLRGENTMLRDENAALGEEMKEKDEKLEERDAIIRSLRDQVAVLTRKGKEVDEKEEEEDEDEGGAIRGANGRRG
jgi:hypothetical protein